MKKLLKLLPVLFISFLLTSCSITMPVNATSNKVGEKVGTSQATVVLGFAFNEDASIKTAAKNGGITKISTVDIKSKNILYIVRTYETIVTGQ